MKIEEIREIVKNYTLLSELARDYAKLHFRYAPITDMAERVTYSYYDEEFIVDFINVFDHDYVIKVPLYYLTMSPDEVKEEFKRRERVKDVRPV